MEAFVKSKDIGFVDDGINFKKLKELIMYINWNRDMLDEKQGIQKRYNTITAEGSG